jgi:hypothetical protein
MRVVDPTHPATALQPDPWVHSDEWYNFSRDPSPDVDVLLVVDETTYTGGTMGPSHPVAWSREVAGSRSFYSAIGHRTEAWSDPIYLAHVEGGLSWVLETAGTPGRGPSASGSGSGSGSDSGSGAELESGSPPESSSEPESGSGSGRGADPSSEGRSLDDESDGCGCRQRGGGLPWLLAPLLRTRRARARHEK